MSKQWFMENMPAFAMILLQILYASMSLTTKATLDKGFSPLIFLVYRQTASSILLIPVSIIVMRRKPAEKTMGMKGFFLVFIASLIGVTMNTNFYYKGLKLASATMASVIYNLIPAETFLIAAAVGLEKVRLWNIRSMAKVVGTVICIGGAMVMVLLKGQKLLNEGIIVSSFLQAAGDNWLLGGFFLIASTACWSSWLIIQGICCALSYFVQSWCIAIRGPLFSAMFTPLGTVITSILASFLLHEELYIGSLVGAAAIVAGLYVVLWGKAKDIEESQQLNDNHIKIGISVEKSKKISENNLQEPLICSSNEHC